MTSFSIIVHKKKPSNFTNNIQKINIITKKIDNLRNIIGKLQI